MSATIGVQIGLFDVLEVPLTKGVVALIDAIGGDLLDIKWYAQGRGLGEFYALSTGCRMHRVVLERKLGRPLLRNEKVDHISGNRVDNRRCNLRLATWSQNNRNAARRRDNTSGYKGVSWHIQHRKWTASIFLDGRNKCLGLFGNKEDAYAAYCDAAKKYFGEYARFE